MATYDSILTQANNQNTAGLDQLESFGNAAITAAQGSYYVSGGDLTDIPDPIAAEPSVFIPATASNEEWVTWMSEGGQAFIEWMLDGTASPVNKLDALFQDYISRYFPTSTDGFDAATAWIENAILNGGTGLPAATETAIYTRDCDRRATALAQSLAQITDAYAASGAPCPPGAMYAQQQEALMEWQRGNQQASTDISIEAVRIEIANVRLAVEMATKLRFEAVQAAGNYIINMLKPGFDSIGSAALVGDKQSAMVNAAANYFRSRLAKDELLIAAGKHRQDIAIQNSNLNLTIGHENIKSGVLAATGAADAYAKGLQGYFSSLSAIGASVESV